MQKLIGQMDVSQMKKHKTFAWQSNCPGTYFCFPLKMENVLGLLNANDN